MDQELTRIQMHAVIQNNDSLDDVKQIARALLETNYAAKEMIQRLMLGQLPGATDPQAPTY